LIVAPKGAGPRAVRGLDNGGIEVIGQAFALLFCGGIQQPHQQKKRHHRGHEIRIGDLPCPAMVAALIRNGDALNQYRGISAIGGHCVTSLT